MPPRKPHTKSRRGCVECKRRHTKCDERHPQCSTCGRLGIDCTWPTWKPLNSSTSTPAPAASEVSTPGVINSFNNISRSLRNFSPAPEDLAIDDLRLLHHFSTKTYATLDSVVSQQGIWRESVIQIGFQHPFLLRGVLAISALHLATLHPESSAHFLGLASKQYNRGLLDFRNVLHDVREENCVAVFVFSCFTVLHAFAVAQVHKPQDPIADFLNCMRLVQGVSTVLKPHYPALMMSELRPILENSTKGGVQGEIPEILLLKTLVNSLPEDDHGETSNAYMHAIDLLHTVWLEAKSSSESQSYLALLLTWPALLSPIFFSSLSIQEPVAVIIMAHFAAILGRKRDVWWIAGWTEYITSSAQSRLSHDLLQWLAWPIQMCNTRE